MSLNKILNIFGEKYKLKSAKMEAGTAGRCIYDKKSIVISDELKDNTEIMHTILHEMIHAISFRVSLYQVIDPQMMEIVCDTIPTAIVENFDLKFKKK